jgi:carbonic anhydrase
MYKKLAIITLTVISLPGAAYVHAEEPHAAHWDYTGKADPTHWGDLSPDYAQCKLGKHQSPIDITNTTKAQLTPLQFDYHSIPLVIENNGHTIKVNADNAGTLTIGKDSYKLVQFHVHDPSEEAINGKRADLVIHLVHQNEKGQLAVVAVLFNASSQKNAANPLLEAELKVLPPTPGKPQTYKEVKIDVNQLLPKDRNYYTYEGSLTVPPCQEGVKWIVLKQTVSMSLEELAKFRALYPNNARPLQPVRDRQVFSSD